MGYHEYKVPRDLSHMVACIWIYRGYQSAAQETLVADGHSELICHLGSPYSELTRDGWVIQPSVLVAGQLTKPLVLRPTPDAHVVAVRFTPAGIASFVREHATELTDCRLDSSHFFSTTDLLRLLQNAKDDSACLKHVIGFLRQSVNQSQMEKSQTARLASSYILKTGGEKDVKAVARKLGISIRTLELQFQRYLGVSPKCFSRIVKFQNAIQSLEERRDSWANLACDIGYFDQSHFIRDFKDFSGQSPSQYLSNTGDLTKNIYLG